MAHKWRASFFSLLLVGSLGLIFLATSSVHAALPEDITSYWKLDETAAADPGNTYEDFVNAPGGNNGEVPASPGEFAPDPNLVGKVGGAQDFDGATMAIDVPDANNDFDWLGDESFSIEFWMQGGPDCCTGSGVQNNEVMVGRDDGTIEWWLGCNRTEGGGDPNDGVARFQLDDGSDQIILYSSGQPINDGAWYHIVGVRDVDDPLDKVVRLYVNGIEVDSVADTTADFDSAANLNLGWLDVGGGGFYFDGTLDNIAVYGRVLTQGEITTHYNNGDGIALENAVAEPDEPAKKKKSGGGGGGCFIGTITE